MIGKRMIPLVRLRITRFHFPFAFPPFSRTHGSEATAFICHIMLVINLLLRNAPRTYRKYSVLYGTYSTATLMQ